MVQRIGGGDNRDRDRGIIHHDDRDRRNNAVTNLRAMHHRCHVQLHRTATQRIALHIDTQSSERSYRQLADQFATALAAGTYAKGDPIPSLTTLIQETGLARATIQHAVSVLEDEGLVVRVSGRGTFVR
jgi:DNA-binding transcriptional ArsR family regulator